MKTHLSSNDVHNMVDNSIEVVSTSSATADISPIVLAETDLIRLKFVPMIDNTKESQKSISGH